MRRCVVLVVLAACVESEPDIYPDDGYGSGGPPPSCAIEQQVVTIPVGRQPSAIVGGRYVDGTSTSLVVANTASNSIHIIRHTSETTLATTEVPTGLAPSAVALANMYNHRIGEDIVVANSGDDTISVYRNRTEGGDVTYGQAMLDPPVTIAVGRHPSAITRIFRTGGDYLAVANRDDNTISIIVNDAGNLYVGATLQVGRGPIALAAASADNPATDIYHYSQDLVVANQDDNTIGILLNSGDDRTFGRMTTYATQSAPIAISAVFQNANDPIDDLWVANAGSNSISSFQHQGGGAYAAAVTTATTGSPRGIVHDVFGRTAYTDYDHGVVDGRTVGPHPVGLVAELILGVDDFAVVNPDAGTVTINARICMHSP